MHRGFPRHESGNLSRYLSRENWACCCCFQSSDGVPGRQDVDILLSSIIMIIMIIMIIIIIVIIRQRARPAGAPWRNGVKDVDMPLMNSE